VGPAQFERPRVDGQRDVVTTFTDDEREAIFAETRELLARDYEAEFARHREWREQAIAEGRYREWPLPAEPRPLVQRSAPDLVYKIRHEPAPAPAPAPAQPEPFTQLQHDVIAMALNMLRRDIRAEFDAKLAAMREEKSAEVVQLPDWPRRGRRNDAA
jgi:hypothetical protein